MSKKTYVRIPTLGKGRAVEIVCYVMMALSILASMVAAETMGKVPVMAYGASMILGEEYSRILVFSWLGLGGVSAAFWFVLSGVGSLMQWKELDYLTRP